MQAVTEGPVFTFDPNEHRYFLDGVEIPGVTTIIKTAGLSQFWGGFTQAQLRGLHVHEACEYLDLHDLDWGSVYPQWVGYVRSYERFKQETGFEPELIEYQTYHPIYRFATTIDRRGRLRNESVILDLKTGAEEDWHKWQTAGQQICGGDAWSNDRRGDIYLHEDGSTATLEWHDDPNDLKVFMAALTICHTKWSLR